MGAAQASDTVFSVLKRSRERGDRKATPEELEQLRSKVKETLRRTNRHSLRRGPRLGRRHHSAARYA
jgi:hypothetical protein